MIDRQIADNNIGVIKIIVGHSNTTRIVVYLRYEISITIFITEKWRSEWTVNLIWLYVLCMRFIVDAISNWDFTDVFRAQILYSCYTRKSCRQYRFYMQKNTKFHKNWRKENRERQRVKESANDDAK